jgi:phosphoglycerol transferase MdoB-like AlkP superfamily enzyme
MHQRLTIFLRLILFWIAFMILARALFMVYNHDLSATLSNVDIMLAMLHGLRMDASISGYFLALSGLILTVSVFYPGRWVDLSLGIITITLLCLSGLIVVADMELYRHWGFRMNNSPFFYMGSGAVGSVDVAVVIKLLSIFILMTCVFCWVYLRYINPRINGISKSNKRAAFVMLALSAAMFLPIRGSFSVAPMNSGFVYFHKTKAYANHAAINVIWNFLYSLQKGDSDVYPENFFDSEKTATLFNSLYPENNSDSEHDSTLYLLNTKRPNVIIIILESFTADVIEPLGGMPEVAPRLSKLCSEGILFDQFYASGDRTDKGIIAVLSGYPAQPTTSIIKNPSKTQSLPQLNPYLKKLGYRSSFIYGGDIDFANFRSYLTTGGYDHITTMDDFEDDKNTSKWGVHDHFMFAQALAELDTTQGLFTKVVLTLSSHEPFDVPLKSHIKGTDEESLFLNACHYTDKCLGEFIDNLKKKNFWSNTLVIITADHGHRHPHNKAIQDKERFKIPLLMLGGAIKKDTVIHTLSGQTDIANTLLAQLDKSHAEFKFSKNILAKNAVPFAAYFFNDGYGFLLPQSYIVYDNPGQQFLKTIGADQHSQDLSKAYQQYLFSDFNKR